MHITTIHMQQDLCTECKLHRPTLTRVHILRTRRCCMACDKANAGSPPDVCAMGDENADANVTAADLHSAMAPAMRRSGTWAHSYYVVLTLTVTLTLTLTLTVTVTLTLMCTNFLCLPLPRSILNRVKLQIQNVAREKLSTQIQIQRAAVSPVSCTSMNAEVIKHLTYTQSVRGCSYSTRVNRCIKKDYDVSSLECSTFENFSNILTAFL